MAVAKKGTKSTEVVESNVVFKSNVKPTAEKKLPIGKLNVLLGVGGSVELFSHANYIKVDGTRLMIRASKKNGEEYQLLCGKPISDALRNAETEEEFDELLDSVIFTDVYHSVLQEKNRTTGALLFDDNEEPIMGNVYFLGSDNDAVDVSNTKKVITKIEDAPETEKTVFSWERLSAQ